MSAMRVGLAGVGIHGGRYAAHLLAEDVPGATLGAISRANVREGSLFALQNNVAYVADPRELATFPGLDAVVVCLPPDLHPDVALACLEAGRPVLVEKPLAPNGAQAARVVAAVEATGTPLMVAHTLRFDPLIVAMRREMAALGAIRMIAASQRFEPTSRGWIDTPGRGGTILNTGVHAFDLLRYLSGAEIVSVRADAARVVTTHTEDEFAAIVRLEPGGLLAVVDNARTTAGRSGRIEIVGERGQLRGDYVHRELILIEGRARRELGPIATAATVAEAMRAFVACLAAGLPMPVTAEDGAAAVRAVDAARASIPTRNGAISPCGNPRRIG
jgi:predicted dehydrogenase